jgi:hypothetical protein
MSVGKYISLEEVHRNLKLLARFMKQHASEGDADRFHDGLASIVKAASPADQTSPKVNGGDCSETQTRQDISPDASRRRARASRE